MSRYRLQPAPAQVAALLEHCAHARFVWNLAVEQHEHWRPGRKTAPGFAEQCRQLTQARAEFPWLRAGSIIVQQQALKDFAQAMANFFGGTHRRPTWRRRGRSEGFRVVAFAAIPEPIPAPGNHETVGVDRGAAVHAALSTGERLSASGLHPFEQARLRRLMRRLARSERGSRRHGKVKAAIARLKGREVDRRKDWVEKTSTELARRFDVIAVEDLKIGNMTRSARGTMAVPGKNVLAKAGLNRSILSAGWGQLVERLEQKAPGRVVRVSPAYTSQRCSACGVVDAKARESQAVLRCRSCGYADNADVNAARNMKLAAGHAVSAREGPWVARPVHREPQPILLTV
ncbi:transposase [Nonomuraea sp. NPDC049695]|uniref:RNA-guided endonuclease InsQ/TnpB family protein n=1 Tax=Nonomuraea sp. NPDC049695 TaxID=3154734 RepID=UPI00341CCF68